MRLLIILALGVSCGNDDVQFIANPIEWVKGDSKPTSAPNPNDPTPSPTEDAQDPTPTQGPVPIPLPTQTENPSPTDSPTPTPTGDCDECFRRVEQLEAEVRALEKRVRELLKENQCYLEELEYWRLHCG